MKAYFLKYQNLILSAVLFCSILLSFVCDGFLAAHSVSRESLRLHVLAASDSERDQQVKLMVRDALLRETEDIFRNSKDAEEASKKVIENKLYLEKIADAVLAENGLDYKSSVSIEEEYFETRQYDNVKLPAGKYTACKVVLGSGNGHNWWCIMFPPLCLPAVTEKSDDSVYAVYGENGGNLVTQKSGYKIKFRIVEIVEEIIEEIRNRDK